MDDKIKLIVKIYLKLVLFCVIIETLTRIILLFNPQTESLAFSFVEWIQIFLLGIINDACIFTICFFFLIAFFLSISDKKYITPWSYIFIGVLVLTFIYLACFNTIFDEYGSAAPAVAMGIIAFWIISYGVRFLFPGIRNQWTIAWFWIIALIYVGAILFNTVAEITFWGEFGVRYNFIAVDYLVYTHEVIGNIFESYPMGWIITLWLAVSILCTYFLLRNEARNIYLLNKGIKWKLKAVPAYIFIFICSVSLLNFNQRFQNTDNTYVNELQANGVYKFYDAFLKNSLEFEKFYLTLPNEKVAEIVRNEYGSTDSDSASIDNITTKQTIYPNIVLVTLESMSASYLQHFGSSKNITPTLDSLYEQSLAFDSIFATGNRTVRGLEALTLSLPPCPGQSLVKQENNSDLFSIAKVLRDNNGYSTTYFYGGNAYFDNMESFFSGNGYEIVDRKSYSPEEITFSNIWGVCDEDSYTKAITTIDSKLYCDSTPFFAHIMTVSNHRPFTYPEGKISIPPDSKSRDGGVMYSDFALGQFLKEAQKKEWFNNTVFLITADHCASSAGSTDIPLAKYHIPALIYAPEIIEPQNLTKVASQIDLMPTLLSIIGIDYDSEFYGKNIMNQNFTSRAFIATYQDLGYLEGDVFTVLSPVKRYKQYKWTPTLDNPFYLEVLNNTDEEMLEKAISLYQHSTSKSHQREGTN